MAIGEYCFYGILEGILIVRTNNCITIVYVNQYILILKLCDYSLYAFLVVSFILDGTPFENPPIQTMEESFNILTTQELNIYYSIFELVSKVNIPHNFSPQNTLANAWNSFQSNESIPIQS